MTASTSQQYQRFSIENGVEVRIAIDSMILEKY